MIGVALNPVMILLATLCLQWVALASSGPLSLQVPYFALALVILYAASGPRKLISCAEFIRANSLWLVPLTIYLTLLGVALWDSPIETMAPRQLLFVLGSIAFAGCVAATAQAPRIFRLGAIVGLVVFVGAVELLARRIGLSWADAAVRFVNGDFNFVIFAFFRGVFNAFDVSGEISLGAATKNTVAVSLLVIAFLFRSGSPHPSRDVLGIVVVSVAILLLLMLNTRSVLIVAGISLVMTTAVGAFIRPVRNLPLLIIKGAGLLALLIFVAAVYLPNEEASSSLSDRFAFDDYSAASRVEQFQIALQQIEKSPLTGSGYFEVNGHLIHNLFLAAWVHAGLAAFILVVIFYFALFGKWFATVATIVTSPRRWVLPIAFEWIAPLPVLPLFRVWLSGDAGNLFLGEWLAVAAFFGCVLANNAMRRRLAGMHAAIHATSGEPRPTLAAQLVSSGFIDGSSPGSADSPLAPRLRRPQWRKH